MDIEALHDERRPLPRHRDPRARQGRVPEDPRRARGRRASRSSRADAPACSSSPRRRCSAPRSRGSPKSTGRQGASSSARRSSSTTSSTDYAGAVRSRPTRASTPSGRTSSHGADRTQRDGLRRQPRRRLLRAAWAARRLELGHDRRSCSATASARSLASPTSWPTTSPSRAAHGAIPTTPASRSAVQIGGEWFYRNLALLLVNYATGSYDDFDGEEDMLGGRRRARHRPRREGPRVAGRLPALADRRALPVEPDRVRPGVAGAARPVRRGPIRRVGRRRAPAVLCRAHAGARLGRALVAPQGQQDRRASRRRTSRSACRTRRATPADPTPAARTGSRDARPGGDLQRARAPTTPARRRTCCATSSASCRRSRPSSATATPSITSCG